MTLLQHLYGDDARPAPGGEAATDAAVERLVAAVTAYAPIHATLPPDQQQRNLDWLRAVAIVGGR